MTPEHLIDRAAAAFGVDPALVLSPCRAAQVVTARYAVIWALRQNGWTEEAIGAFLDRDHSTVSYALDMAEARCGMAALEELRCEVVRHAPRRPIDWRLRVDQLERRVADLEALLVEYRRAA